MTLAIDGNTVSVFGRKNSIYPDLPKGRQTSQYELSIREHGRVDILTKAGPRTVGVTRTH